MERKQYPASDLKLQRLREAGTFPRSADVASLGCLTGFGLAILLLWRDGAGFIHYFSQAFSTAAAPGEIAWGALAQLRRASALVLGVVAAVVILFGLFQSRFLFRLGLFRLDFSRIFSLAANLLEPLPRGIALGVLALIKSAAWITVAVLLLIYTLSAVARLFTDGPGGGGVSLEATVAHGASELLQGAQQVFWANFLGALAFLFFLAILSRFLVVLWFRHAHRMTRSELEAEFRETEISPEFKASRREARD